MRRELAPLSEGGKSRLRGFDADLLKAAQIPAGKGEERLNIKLPLTKGANEGLGRWLGG